MAAYTIDSKGNVTLTMSPAEAKGLHQCADEGAEGLLTDQSARNAYIGNNSQVKAAVRALDALSSAVAATKAMGK